MVSRKAAAGSSLFSLFVIFIGVTFIITFDCCCHAILSYHRKKYPDRVKTEGGGRIGTSLVGE